MVSVSKRDVLHILEPRWTICQTKEVTWQAHRSWKCRTDLSSADSFSEKQIKMVFSSQSRLKCWHLNIKTFMERGTEITCSLQTQPKWFTKLRSPHSRLSRGGVAVYIQTQHWGKMEKISEQQPWVDSEQSGGFGFLPFEEREQLPSRNCGWRRLQHSVSVSWDFYSWITLSGLGGCRGESWR